MQFETVVADANVYAGLKGAVYSEVNVAAVTCPDVALGRTESAIRLARSLGPGPLEKAGVPVRSISTFDPVGSGGSSTAKPSGGSIWKNFFPAWRDRGTGPDMVSKIGGEWNYTQRR